MNNLDYSFHSLQPRGSKKVPKTRRKFTGSFDGVTAYEAIHGRQYFLFYFRIWESPHVDTKQIK